MLKIRFKLPYLIWKDKVSNLLNPDQFAIWTFRPEIWIWTTPQDHITNKHAQCDKSDPPLSIRIRTQDSWQDDKITIITVCVTVSSLVSIGLYDGLTAWLNAEWQYDSLRSVKCGCDSMTVWQYDSTSPVSARNLLSRAHLSLLAVTSSPQQPRQGNEELK